MKIEVKDNNIEQALRVLKKKMQREFDKLDVDLKFMDLAMEIFALIENEIKKEQSFKKAHANFPSTRFCSGSTGKV